MNSFGDEQLAVDMLADKLLFEALRFSVSTRTPPNPAAVVCCVSGSCTAPSISVSGACTTPRQREQAATGVSIVALTCRAATEPPLAV